MSILKRLKPIKEVIQKTKKYIEGRANGSITSLRLGKRKLDKAMIDGVEWNSTITIGGRPSVGKSALSDDFVEGAFESNRDEADNPDFDLLDFNWELSSQVILLRRLSSRLKKSYKYIISAEDNKVSQEEIDEMFKILEEHYGRLPIFFCEEPLTVKEFKEMIVAYCEANPERKVLIRIDHTLLTKMTAEYKGNQVAMLMDLLMTANELKKKYPIIFMFLSQINREFEDRQEDGTDKAFPRQGDIFGGDAAAMFSETMILLNKPSKYGIRQYGNRNNPDKIPPVEEDDLYLHIVKNRNAEGDNMLRYKADFKIMKFKEW